MRHPPRLAAKEYVGRRQYLLTICTHHRRPWFTDRRVVDSVLRQFLRVAVQREVDIVAYCFMPDHVHALVEVRVPTAEFQGFVRRLKQHSGYAFTQTCGQPLWQRSYHDRTIRHDETPHRVVRYIIENPVRAGLVTRVCDYPFWGSQRYSRAEVLEFVGVRPV